MPPWASGPAGWLAHPVEPSQRIGSSRALRVTVLSKEGHVPEWFAGVERVHWSGQFFDLTLVPGASLVRTLLVAEKEECVRDNQRDQWVRIAPLDPAFNRSEDEIDRVLRVLALRTQQTDLAVDPVPPPPPDGYPTWLDYCVGALDYRAAVMSYLFSGEEGRWSRADIERAVRGELAALRRRA